LKNIIFIEVVLFPCWYWGQSVSMFDVRQYKLCCCQIH